MLPKKLLFLVISLIALANRIYILWWDFPAKLLKVNLYLTSLKWDEPSGFWEFLMLHQPISRIWYVSNFNIGLPNYIQVFLRFSLNNAYPSFFSLWKNLRPSHRGFGESSKWSTGDFRWSKSLGVVAGFHGLTSASRWWQLQLGKWSNLTIIFFNWVGKNHQLDFELCFFFFFSQIESY